MLANAEGDILGDEQLILSLEETKATSQEIAAKARAHGRARASRARGLPRTRASRARALGL